MNSIRVLSRACSCLLILFSLLVSSIVAPRAAMAQFDVTGTWSASIFIGGSFNNTQTWNLVQSGTSLGGTGSGGSFTWVHTGTVSGSTIHNITTYDQISYNATFIGTITDNDNMSGSWTDSGNQSGTFVAVRSGGTPPPTGTEPTTTTIGCNRGPEPSDDFLCTATVASAQTHLAPSGVVTFTTDSGSFRNGHDCTLVASTATPGSSSCGVLLMQPTPPIGAGQPIPISASYPGDTNFNQSSSSGSPTANVIVLPKTPSVCFSDPGSPCNGLNASVLNPVISAFDLGEVTIGYFVPTDADAIAFATARMSAAVQGGPLPGALLVFEAQRAAELEIGTLSRTASQSKAVKGRKGDIDVIVRFTVSSKNNPQINTNVRAIKPFAKKLRAGMTLGGLHKKIGFGTQRKVVVPLDKQSIKLVNALATSGVRALNIQAVVQARRPQDRKSTKVTRATSATVLAQ